ncbi:aminotransferase class I/II-fold pyridoxal phosphate-dependent enzyme [Telluribacter humicola]|uniref:aminotransferase class I/II-fold pyridoxal phosphate-dependent enzyme n=1 Tax=Telluribacter humicola TaxID=1720261 RepID=UPI001A9608AC|nr:aminotransferase class I/II-fold pyridoxal phosphate-dependent enzyme [Telluribacter humicola]
MNKTFTIHELPGRTVPLEDGKRYLWFSGTDYLGMGHNPTFQKYLHEGIEHYGTHFGSSRNNTLRLAAYEEAELALAQFTGAASALSVSSGMWAGQLVMKYLENSGPTSDSSARYHFAPCVHPALWGAHYQPSAAASWTEWAKHTVQAIQEAPAEQVHVICTDSIGSPWVEAYDFSIFEELPADKPIWLVVDDSHGLGVLGEQGCGILRLLPHLPNIHTLVVSSLNKAMGIPAGVILAEDTIVQEIRRLPWFSGSSPSAPAYMYALTRLLQMGEYPKAHQQLLANARYFSDKVRSEGLFVQYDDYPVYCSRNVKLYEHLLNHGILSACFPYPRPNDEPVMRVVISAYHQKEDLDQLAEVCNTFSS